MFQSNKTTTDRPVAKSLAEQANQTPVTQTTVAPTSSLDPKLTEDQAQYEALKIKNSRSNEEGEVVAAFDELKAAELTAESPVTTPVTRESRIADAKKRLKAAQEALVKSPSNTV